MKKSTGTLWTLVLICLFTAMPLKGDDQSGRIGLELHSGVNWLWQGSGNILITEPAEQTALSDAGMIYGGKLKVVVAPEFAVQFSTQHSQVEYAGYRENADSMLAVDKIVTKIWPFDICAIINLAPEFKLNPYLLFGGGLSHYLVQSHEGGDKVTMSEDTKGAFKFGGGLEVYMTDRISLDVLFRYSYIFTPAGDDIFTAKFEKSASSDVGPSDQVNGQLDLQVGLAFYLGGQRDNDGDGILNKQDKCPNEAEDFDSYEDEDGCPEPDNDMDGIPDNNDRCATVPEDIDGYEDHDGCPDKDNDQDGVADKLDKCPNNAEDKDGFEDEDGCPDEDNDQDGVLDINDRCANEPEDVDNYEDYDGCPDLDNDKDGVPDGQDKCGNTPQGVQVDSVGCPMEIIKDSDEDGILDENDKCPTMKEDMDGFEDMDGCPDLDNDQDGKLDAQDKCPNQAEDIDNFQDDDGCPEIDNDQDGLPDTEDKCPGTDATVAAGENTKETRNEYKDEDGCPDEKPQEIKRGKMILRGVNFESGSAAITDDSYMILNQVFESLEAYEEVTVEIRGYTDNRGGYQYNIDLSQKRAEAVRQYLLNRGIAPDRLTAKGFGPADPIASNNNAAGRAQNRRIEFHRND